MMCKFIMFAAVLAAVVLYGEGIDLSSYTVALPNVELPTVDISSPSETPKEVRDFSLPLPVLETGVTAASAPLPVASVEPPRADVDRFFVRNTDPRDTRSLFHTAGIVDWEAWGKALNGMSSVTYPRKSLTKDARVIAEVRSPRSFQQQETLRRNIEFYKANGYNAVLYVVTERDTVETARDTCVVIRYYGMRIYLVFGGTESLYTAANPDPVKLREVLNAAAPYAECFMLSWRRTSAHLLLQDSAYMKYLIGCVRETNPDIPVLGELFYGESFNKVNNDVRFGLAENLDDCVCGALVTGLGTSRTDYDNAVPLLKSKLPSGAGTLAMVIIGERPYYLTQGERPAFNKSLATKRRLEDRARAAGFRITVTMSDDGSDGRYHTDENNNLSETLYTQL